MNRDPNNIAEICDNIIRWGIADSGSVLPCSMADISEIGSKYGIVLPPFYRDFLLTMGRGAGRFMCDVGVYYPDCLTIHEEATAFLTDNSEGDAVAVSKNVFIFAERLFEQFFAFDLNSTGADPQVLYLSEDMDEFEVQDYTFHGFLLAEARLSRELMDRDSRGLS